MKKSIFKNFFKLLAAGILAAGLAGCSNLLDTEEKSSGENQKTGNAQASLFIPNYAELAKAASARAIAPQTASVKLSSTATPAAFTDITKELSEGTSTDATNSSNVAGKSYTFTFSIPVGTYAANSLKVELLDSSSNVLSSGANSAEVVIEEGKTASANIAALPSVSVDAASGSLAAGEMKFTSLTVKAGVTYSVSTTGGVSLYVFDSNGKLLNTDDIPAPFTGTSITGGDEDATYYVGIYSESAVESYSVGITATAVLGKEYDIHSIVNKTSSATSTDDGAITWSGVTDNGTGWTYLSASTESLTSQVSINVSGAAVVTLGTYQNKTNGNTITVSYTDSDGATGTIVDAVTDTSSIAPAFLYSGTKPAVITITAGGMVYLNTVTVTDGADAANGAASVAVTGDGSIVKGNTATYTAAATAKYINTDSNAYTAGTAAWTVTDSDGNAVTGVSISDAGVLTVADTLASDTTLKVTATIDGVSGSIAVSAATAAATSYDKVTWAFNTNYGSLASVYTDSALTTAADNSTLQGTSGTGYVADATYKVPLYVDASSGKFQVRSSGDAQVNSGTKIYIPVSSGSTVTATHNNQATYTLNGTACSKTAVYTATSAGYVVLESTDSSYFYKIEVTGLDAGDVLAFTDGALTTTQAEGSVTSGAVVYYTVTFNANNDSASITTTTQRVESGVATALTSAETLGLSYDGYTFSKWNTAADGSGTEYADGASVTLTEDTTLYAVWTEDSTGGEATLTKYTEYFASYNTDGSTTYTELESTSWVTPDVDSTYYFASGVTLSVGSSSVDSKIAKKSTTIGSYSATDCIQFGKKSNGSKITIPITASGTIKIGYTSNNTSAVRGLLATASSGTLTSRSLGTTGEIYTSTAASTAFYGDLANTAEIAVFNYTGDGGTVTLECCSDASGTTAAGACYIWFIDVTDVVTLSSTTYAYSAPAVTLDSATVVLGSSATATATIPDATVTYTYSDSSTTAATEEVSATITWSATDSNGTDASSIIDSDGKITATAEGTYLIYASYTDGNGESQKSEAATLTVQGSSVAVTGISVYASDDEEKSTSGSVLEGSTLTLEVSVSPEDATDSSVTWSSSDTTVATVTDAGVVTGVAAGTATITATAADGSGVTGTYRVTVKALTTIASYAFTASSAPSIDSNDKGTNMQVTFKATDSSTSFSVENVTYDSSVDAEYKSSGSKALKLGANVLYLSVTLGSYDTDGNFTASTDTFKAGDIIYITGTQTIGVSTSTEKLNGDSNVGSVATGSTSKSSIKVSSLTLPSSESITYTNTLYLSRYVGTGTDITNIVVKRVSE